MKITTSKKVKTVTFGDLGEGEVFKLVDDSQIQIKTDEDSGCCLESGVLYGRDEDDEVVKVNCELVVS